MLGRPPPNPCPPSNKMLFSPHFGSERHSVSLQTPYSPKGGGDWDTKINIPVKMHLRCCALARIFANYSRMAININDYSWSINDHSCPHKNISSALRALCVLERHNNTEFSFYAISMLLVVWQIIAYGIPLESYRQLP